MPKFSKSEKKVALEEVDALIDMDKDTLSNPRYLQKGDKSRLKRRVRVLNKMRKCLEVM